MRYHVAEAVVSIELLLQSYYLQKKSATYAEAFYSFKRSKKTLDGLGALSKLDIIVSLVFETLLPYLKNRFEKYLDESNSTSSRARILRAFGRSICKIANLLIFAYKFRFLVDENFSFFKPYF